MHNHGVNCSRKNMFNVVFLFLDFSQLNFLSKHAGWCKLFGKFKLTTSSFFDSSERFWKSNAVPATKLVKTCGAKSKRNQEPTPFWIFTAVSTESWADILWVDKIELNLTSNTFNFLRWTSQFRIEWKRLWTTGK